MSFLLEARYDPAFPFYTGAFLDSTGIVRAWVAGSGDASALSTLTPNLNGKQQNNYALAA